MHVAAEMQHRLHSCCTEAASISLAAAVHACIIITVTTGSITGALAANYCVHTYHWLLLCMHHWLLLCTLGPHLLSMIQLVLCAAALP